MIMGDHEMIHTITIGSILMSHQTLVELGADGVRCLGDGRVLPFLLLIRAVPDKTGLIDLVRMHWIGRVI